VRALDTNVIVRALLQDDAKQSPIAAALLISGQELRLTTTIALEVAWTLRVRGFADAEVADILRALVAGGIVAQDEDALLHACTLVESGIELADALHLTCAGSDVVVTFDKAFVKSAARGGLGTRVKLLA
jgi:predicted nucleic acid-binding protein